MAICMASAVPRAGIPALMETGASDGAMEIADEIGALGRTDVEAFAPAAGIKSNADLRASMVV
jgi:hypothetical protein